MAKFRTKARAVDLLGKQQIRDEVTAISELLRNSYDADSSEGIVDISTENERIIVSDDGEGMTEEELTNNWLTIGTYSKFKSYSQKTSKGRIKIGEKGIGRLAISVLGDQLLIITKKREKNDWSLLYLHWGLFRNERLYLEDIQLPIRSFGKMDELIYFLKNHLDDIKIELKANLLDRSKWDIDVANSIQSDIDVFFISDDVIHRIRTNERRGGGTIFFIKNMEDTWDWSLYKLAVEDESRIERKRRLQNVLVSFTNLIDLFDRNAEETNKNNFNPKIQIDDLKLEIESWFNPEDIQLYDYALKGTIENGAFSGQAFIRNSKNIDVYDLVDIDLTSGIHTTSSADCGPVQIKWFFIEGKEELTSLSKDQFKMMSDKLGSSGGIYVFRDGLRILPYGEPGNDFLKIEERRTRGAGYYLFSHRRMYGFMEISKVKNPSLVDKSSREGFVENKAFEHFIATAQNLLLWWARDFLESRNENGKRQTRFKRLKEERERDERITAQQREEERREAEYFKALYDSLSKFDMVINNQFDKIKGIVDYQIEYALQSIQNKKNDEISFNDFIYSVRLNLYKLIDNLERNKINYNSRYFHDSELMEQIDLTRIKTLDLKERLQDYIDSKISTISLESLAYSEEGSTSDKQLKLISRLNEAINWANNIFNDLYRNVVDAQLTSLKEDLQKLQSDILVKYNVQLQTAVNTEIVFMQDEVEDKCRKLKAILQKINSLEYLLYTEESEKEAENALIDFERLMNYVHDKILRISLTLKEIEATRNMESLISDIRNRLAFDFKYESDNNYIGFLKKEVNMYRELSAVGLAAELTSHEFNALYNKIQHNLSILYKSLSQTKALPIVENTRNAFKSLERLHQRMNPLYRQVRARKTEINLHQFINNVLEYFESDFVRYGITRNNKVSENIIVKENESLLFTPLVNIVSNAIYWVLNREAKEIHFYTYENKLFIHDTGPGIDQKDQLRIFEPYFTRKAEGRGLGLFLSRDILETRGHKLFLVSPGDEIYPIGGACFCIDFNIDSLEVR